MLSRTALCIQHQAVSRTNAFSHRIVSRSMHLSFRIQSNAVRTRSVGKLSRYAPVLGSYSKRYSSTTESTTSSGDGLLRIIETPGKTAVASTADVSNTSVGESPGTIIIDPIPDLPPIPPPQTVLETVADIGEPPLSALGLGDWWPPGMIQQCLEYLHVGAGLPWWECIVVGTVVLRLTLFPLVVISQRNSVTMSNNMPQMQRIQEALSEARKSGNQLEAARHAQEMMYFMKDTKCNPLKNMIVPMAQAPIFLSVFLGLRRMADAPVESMKEGGLWWFQDLTVADPYYILPLITAATLSATIEIGTDSAKAQTMGMMRYVLRAIPLVILPFTLHFPGAILCYWCSSNFISLCQVGILQIPKVREFFKIPPMVKHSPTALTEQKSFVDGFKSSWSNMKTTRELNARLHVSDVAFHQAGRGPVRKTYPYDPTKQKFTQPKLNAIQAKKR